MKWLGCDCNIIQLNTLIAVKYLLKEKECVVMPITLKTIEVQCTIQRIFTINISPHETLLPFPYKKMFTSLKANSSLASSTFVLIVFPWHDLRQWYFLWSIFYQHDTKLLRAHNASTINRLGWHEQSEISWWKTFAWFLLVFWGCWVSPLLLLSFVFKTPFKIA